MYRMILNETSYFGAGCRESIAIEAARRGFKKAFFVTDKDLIRFKVADKVIEVFEKNNIPYTETTEFNEDVIADADIIYMTRVQRERFADIMEYERVKDLYNLNSSMLGDARENMRILHPLPRVNEIAQDVDANPKAYYFQQAQNGLYVREAIICDVLGITI